MGYRCIFIFISEEIIWVTFNFGHSSRFLIQLLFEVNIIYSREANEALCADVKITPAHL